MARIRTIKPHFFKSRDVMGMSYQARLTWIGLWTYVDDEGRGRDDAHLIKGELWPLEDDMTWQSVEVILTELSRSAHVVRYTVENRDFLAIPKWADHQVISRPTKSKFPAPSPENIREVAPLMEDSLSIHGGLHVGTGNREQGKGTGNREKNLSLNAPDFVNVIELFDVSFSHWPKRVKREEALTRFKAATKTKSAAELAETIQLFGDAYAATTETKYVPALGVWLNQKRWTDELPVASQGDRKQTPTERNQSYVERLMQEELRAQRELTA
jgi:hypothetical protein